MYLMIEVHIPIFINLIISSNEY